MLGDRGIWHEGWKAVTRHKKGADFEADIWELYHVENDFSENNNLALEYPEKLKMLIDLWWSEAEKYLVLPLDDRDRERTAASLKATSRKKYIYYPGMARVDRLSAPNVANRSYQIEAEIEIDQHGANGVLFAAGGRFGGYVLFLQDNYLIHEYNCGDERRLILKSPSKLSAGAHHVSFSFKKTSPLEGIGILSYDGVEVASLAMDKMWPLLPNATGIHCGRDDGSPVSESYSCPNTFNGNLKKLIVKVEDDQEIDFLKEYYAALADD